MRFPRLNVRWRWIVAVAAAFGLGVASVVAFLVFFNESETTPVVAGFLERPRVVPDPQPTPGSDAVGAEVIQQAASENLHFDQPAGELWWDGPTTKNVRWRLTPALGVEPDKVTPTDPDKAPVDPDKVTRVDPATQAVDPDKITPVDPDKVTPVDPDKVTPVDPDKVTPVDPDKAATATPAQPDAGIDPELLPGAFIAPQAVFSLSDGRCDSAPDLRLRYGIPQMIAVEDARWFWPVRAVLRDQSWFNTGFSHDGWQIFQADDPDQAFLVYGPDPNFAIEYRTFLCGAPA